MERRSTQEVLDELRKHFSISYEDQVKQLRYDSLAFLDCFLDSCASNITTEDARRKYTTWSLRPRDIVTKYKGGNCVGLADHLLATIDEEEVRHKFRWIYAERADQQHLALVVINSPDYILFDPGLHLPEPVIITPHEMKEVAVLNGKKSFLFAHPNAPWPERFEKACPAHPPANHMPSIAFYCYGVDTSGRGVDTKVISFFIRHVSDEEVLDVAKIAISGDKKLRYAYSDRSNEELFAVTIDVKLDQCRIWSGLETRAPCTIAELLIHPSVNLPRYSELKQKITRIKDHCDQLLQWFPC